MANVNILFFFDTWPPYYNSKGFLGSSIKWQDPIYLAMLLLDIVGFPDFSFVAILNNAIVNVFVLEFLSMIQKY